MTLGTGGRGMGKHGLGDNSPLSLYFSLFPFFKAKYTDFIMFRKPHWSSEVKAAAPGSQRRLGQGPL